MLRFPADLEQGRYMVHMEIVGGGTVTLGSGVPDQSAVPITPTNCTIPNFFLGGTEKYSFGAAMGTGAGFSKIGMDFVVDVTGNGAYLTAGTMDIAQVPSFLTTDGLAVLTIITQMNMNSTIPIV